MAQTEVKKYAFVTVVYPALVDDDLSEEEMISQAEQGVEMIYDMMYQSDLNSYGKAHSIEILSDAEIYIRTGGLIDVCLSSGECDEDEDEDEIEGDSYDYCPTPRNAALDQAEENATGKEED